MSTRNSAHPRSRLLRRLHLNPGDRQGRPGDPSQLHTEQPTQPGEATPWDGPQAAPGRTGSRTHEATVFPHPRIPTASCAGEALRFSEDVSGGIQSPYRKVLSAQDARFRLATEEEVTLLPVSWTNAGSHTCHSLEQDAAPPPHSQPGARASVSATSWLWQDRGEPWSHLASSPRRAWAPGHAPTPPVNGS